MGRRTASRVRWILLGYTLVVIAAWWLLTHRIDRFWIPVLPVVALLAGAGACWSSERWWRIVLPAILVAGLGRTFWSPRWAPARLVRQPRMAPWRSRANQSVAPILQSKRVRRKRAAGRRCGRIDLMPPVLYNTCFDDCIFEQLVKGRTAAEIRAELAARQIAYVYVDWDEIARYRRTYGFTEFVRPRY